MYYWMLILLFSVVSLPCMLPFLLIKDLVDLFNCIACLLHYQETNKYECKRRGRESVSRCHEKEKSLTFPWTPLLCTRVRILSLLDLSVHKICTCEREGLLLCLKKSGGTPLKKKKVGPPAANSIQLFVLFGQINSGGEEGASRKRNIDALLEDGWSVASRWCNVLVDKVRVRRRRREEEKTCLFCTHR